jgi:hypothetical protein
MQFSIVKSLLFLLPLAAPLARADGVSDVLNAVNGASNAVSDFFGADGPGGKISALPDCIDNCLKTTAADLKCGASDVKCLCGADDGVNWENKVRACNANSTNPQDRCSDDVLRNFDLSDMCVALKNATDAVNQAGDAFGRLLGLNAGASQSASMVTVGVLAAVAGYAVMLL